MVSRSVRGYGFERSSEFTRVSVEATEELTCSCGSEREGDAGSRVEKLLVHVKLDWESGRWPVARGWTEQHGARVEVEPVRISGRLVTYRFRFSSKASAAFDADCASGFFIALNLSEPME